MSEGLFSPIHHDSNQLAASPAAKAADAPPSIEDPAGGSPWIIGETPAVVPFPEPAGTPEKSVSMTSEDPAPEAACAAGLEATREITNGGPDPREPSTLPVPEAGCTDPTPAPASDSSSLDPLETSVKNWRETCATSHAGLDETSLGGRFRHSGWSPYRKRVFESLVRTGQTRTRVEAFRLCGKDAWLMRSNEAEKCVDGQWRHRYKIQATCCHDRLCTPCANGRSRVIQQHLLQQIAGRPVSFITLTLSGSKSGLREMVDRLYKHFRALRLHPTWTDAVTGGAAFLEIKYSDKGKRWHPHLHIIADAKFIAQQDLCDAWRSITKDSFIVDIRRVRDEKVTAAYVTKYASKPLNTSFANDVDLLDEAVMALKGRRLCLCFGDWYGTPLSYAEDEMLGDDLIDAAGYQKWTTLDSLLASALSGDPADMAIMRQLDAFERFVALANPPDAGAR